MRQDSVSSSSWCAHRGLRSAEHRVNMLSVRQVFAAHGLCAGIMLGI